MGGPQGSDLKQVPLTPAMKEEYENLDKLLVQTLYQQGAAEHIIPSLFPQGPHKIKGVVDASVVLARELFLKAKAPPQLVLPFARDVVAHVMQIGEQVKQIQYSDQEMTAAFTAVYEGILHAFGVKKSAFQHMQHLIPRSAMHGAVQDYKNAVGHAQQAQQANASQEHAEHAGVPGPQAQGAGPQGPQGAPPQGGGGGMLSQGAAAGGGAAPEGGEAAPEGGGAAPEQGEAE
jgi:hypothetical protein